MGLRSEPLLARFRKRVMSSLGLAVGSPVRVSGKIYYAATALPEDVVEFAGGEVFLADTTTLGKAPLDVTLSSVHGTTIGCDPEFLILSKSGRLRDAGLLLPPEGKIGSDGVLGELRPHPSTRVTEVLTDIRLLLAKVEGLGFNVSAASSFTGNITLGYHLHFGAPSEILTYAPRGVANFLKTVAEALDVFVGVPSLVRDPDDKRRTDGINYGMPADFRMSNVTFEYRTPGGYNLRSYKLAGSLMDVALLAYNDIIRRASLFTRGWTRMEEFNTYDHFREAYKLPRRDTVVKAMTSRDRGLALEVVEDSLMCVSRLHDASRHRRSVEMLFNRGHVEDNIFDNWR